MSDLLDSIEHTMPGDRANVAWRLRRVEGEHLAALLAHRRTVWRDFGDDAQERAEELDYLIARSEALITWYGDRCCTGAGT